MSRAAALEPPRITSAGREEARILWRNPLAVAVSASRREAAARHLPWAAVFGILVAASFVNGFVHLPMNVCTAKRIFGFPCMFCGFTRSFTAMAHGHWIEAFTGCPAGALLFLAAAAAAIGHGTALLMGWRLRPGPWLLALARRPKRSALALAALLAANWIYRLALGLG